MIFKKNKTIFEIQGIHTIGNKVFIGYKNKQLFLGDELIEDNVDTTMSSLKSIRYFLIFDKNDDCMVLNTEKKVLYKTGEYRCWPIILSENKLICTYDYIYEGQKMLWKNGVFDLEKNKIDDKYKLPSNCSIVQINEGNSTLISSYACIINKLNYSTNQQLWQTSLSDFGEIVNILGIIEDLLWTQMQKNVDSFTVEFSFVAISISTGIISIIQKNVPQTLAFSCILNPESQKLLLVSNSKEVISYVEFDALNGEKVFERDLTDLADMGFTLALSKNLNLVGDELYITVAKLNSLFGCGIAILNINSREITSAFKVENTKGSIAQAAQVSGNKLYILDTGGTLHIYEKENV